METRPLPEVGDGEVLVKVLAVGICAGDAKCFAGAPYFWGEPTSNSNSAVHSYPHTLISPLLTSACNITCLFLQGSEVWPRYVQPPVIPGHEFIGEVVKLGKGQCG